MTPFGLHAPQGAYAEAAECGSQWVRLIAPWGTSVDLIKQGVIAAKAHNQNTILTVTSHDQPNRQYNWLYRLANSIPALERIQIENEWFRQWTEGLQAYLDHFSTSADAVHTANPDIEIVTGAYTGGVGNSKSDKQGKSAMSRLIALGKHDVVDFHCYSDDPSDPVARIEWLKGEMQKYGGQAPIISTECAGPFNFYSYSAHSSDIVKRYILALTAGIDVLCWSSLVPTAGWAENYLRLSLLDQARHRKPPFYTLKLLAEKTSGLVGVSEYLSAEGIVSYRITRETANAVYVVWGTNGPRTVTTAFPGESVQVTHLVTNPGQIEPIVGIVPVVKNRLTLTVDEPIFVERVA